MVIQGGAGQGIDEDTELHLIGDLVGQSWIKSVDAFKKHHGIGIEMQFLAIVFLPSGHEVELGDVDCLAIEQPQQITLKFLVLYGLKVVEVIGTVGQFGGVFTIDEIVVSGPMLST